MIHQQSMQAAGEVRSLLKNIDAKGAKLQQLAARFEGWNENLIEVPGFEHDHDHAGHHHSHNHPDQTQLDLSPEEMLVVQQQLLDTVLAIKRELLLIGAGSLQ